MPSSRINFKPFHSVGLWLAVTTIPPTASVFSTQSWGAIIAPFIIGLIADRYFNAEKILGILHLAGAFLMYQMYVSNDVGVFPSLLSSII